MKIVTLPALLLLATAVFPTACSADSRPPLALYVDASDGERRLLHAEVVIPVHPGHITLVYPRWGIPTYEAPAATIDNMVRLKMSGNGRPIEWKRDTVDFFAFHVVVPDDVRALNVAMDVIAPAQRSDFNAATGQLVIVDWYTLLLYPQDAAANDLPVKARLRLPTAWNHACALASIIDADGAIEYPATSLATLVDSPVLAGKFFKTVQIASGSKKPVFVDIAADASDAANLPAEWQDRISRVVDESGALFGGYPYENYRFLVALSERVGNDGLEHRESADLRFSVRAFRDEANRLAYGYLLPHEYVHAWNGKFMIPAGLVRRNFQLPQTTELLWVYEGLTRYLNWVLAARSGILTLEEAHDYAALLAAKTSHRSGREWRSLQDTAVSAGILNDAPDQWESLRRGSDYYDEALLMWLEVDTTIRRLTNGSRSLDDFCRAFFGPPQAPPRVKSYTFDDVVSALNGITAYDWRTLLQTRLNATGTDRAPLDGLVVSGWNLVYGSLPGSIQAARDTINRTIEERFSLGLLLQDDGTIIDVVRESPAWHAGLGPGMKLLKVNERLWSAESLRESIAADTGTAPALRLSVQNGAETMTVHIDDHGGARYPHLERNGNPDLMGAILTPRSALPRSQ